MSIVDDVSKVLEKLPIWKRLRNMPDEVDQLRKRIEELEAKLAPATGEQCPRCRAAHFTLADSRPEPGPFGDLGVRQYVYRCSACNYEDIQDHPR